MTYVQARQFTRASELATALEEQLLHRESPALAGEQPINSDDWGALHQTLANLLRTLAWAVRPDPDEQPDVEALDNLPSGLIEDLRARQREGESIAEQLREAAALVAETRSLDSHEPLLRDIARRADLEASDALRRMMDH